MPKKVDYNLNGYIPSPVDERDYTADKIFSAPVAEFPSAYRTEGNVPVLNQGANCDCVAHAIAVAMAYGECKLFNNKFNDYSRGYIYGNRRALDWKGEGMCIRSALKQLNHDGDCLYKVFPKQGPYKVVRALIDEKAEEYAKAAEPYKILNYFRLYSENEIKQAIMAQGAVVVGMTLYEDFGPNVSVPTTESKRSGGHAMCCIGWDETGWIIQNSWGKGWGKSGCCHVPYEYVVDEWWGITVSPLLPTPNKDTWYVRLSNAIKNMFLWLKQHLFRK